MYIYIYIYTHIGTTPATRPARSRSCSSAARPSHPGPASLVVCACVYIYIYIYIYIYDQPCHPLVVRYVPILALPSDAVHMLTPGRENPRFMIPPLTGCIIYIYIYIYTHTYIQHTYTYTYIPLCPFPQVDLAPRLRERRRGLRDVRAGLLRKRKCTVNNDK